MFTDYLWFLNAKQQYERQKELGLAGLMGLLLVIFMVWKWDSIIYPLFYKLGFVEFAKRIGLINEDLAILTVINVLGVIFMLALFIALISFLLTALGGLLLLFGSSALGHKVIGIGLFILFFPVVMLYMIVIQVGHENSPEARGTLQNTYKRDSRLKPLLKEYADHPTPLRNFHLYKEQILREKKSSTVDVIPYSKVKSYLNRAVASIKEDRGWLFGYCALDKQWYVLFPNPLPAYASSCANQDTVRCYDAIYNYQTCMTSKTSGKFFVPAMPIEFEWKFNEGRIKPSIQLETVSRWVGSTDTIQRATMTLKDTSSLGLFQVKSPDISELYDSIAKHEILDKWNRTAHAILYLIPIVHFPYIPLNDRAHAKKVYSDAIENIPNVDVFYPIYAADVEEHLAHFEDIGKDWPTTWVKKVM